MPDLRLAKLPDRTPIKLTISISPDLYRAPGDYALAYERVYDRKEALTDLVPAMLASFTESDRGFARQQRKDRD